MRDLLAAAEAAAADVSPSGVADLSSAVAAARAAAGGGAGGELEATLARAGWGGAGDRERPDGGPGPSFDARALVCALKAAQLSDLEHLGEGTFATCYKVRKGGGGGRGVRERHTKKHGALRKKNGPCEHCPQGRRGGRLGVPGRPHFAPLGMERLRATFASTDGRGREWMRDGPEGA